ncbi:MAG TPA: RsmE family RNA methyltransferase [Candidatus Acidoferrales bacterium]
MRRRFFVDEFRDRAAVLEGDTALHLGRVLRAEPGQLYELSDGSEVWLARVEEVARGRVDFSLVEQLPQTAPGPQVTLLLAVVKFDRFEWCLEKATELGVAGIVPLAAARSDAGLLAAAGKRAKRWQRILVESAQQSRRLAPPALHEVAEPTAAFRKYAAKDSAALFFSERGDAPSLRSILEPRRTASSVVVAIGPEGGWTDAEIAAAETAGYLAASLGPLVLRTESAVISALAAINYALGDSQPPAVG